MSGTVGTMTLRGGTARGIGSCAANFGFSVQHCTNMFGGAGAAALHCVGASGSPGSTTGNPSGGQDGGGYPGGGGSGAGASHVGGAHGQSAIQKTPNGPSYRIGMVLDGDGRQALLSNTTMTR